MTQNEKLLPAVGAAIAGQVVAGALKTQFNATNTEAKQFLHGEITPESKETAAALHAKYEQQVTETVNAAVPEDADDALRSAARDYTIALSRTRKKGTPKQVAEKVQEGIAVLQAETKAMLADLDSLEQALKERIPRERKKLKDPENSVAAYVPRKSFWRRTQNTIKAAFGLGGGKPANVNTVSKDPVGDLFGDAERVYFRLSDFSASPVQPYVEELLHKQGFHVTDYAGGYAMDDRKNTRKIGKLLKDTPALLEAYNDDPFRTGKELMVVMTRSYEDLARGSFGRGWQSCRANPSTAVSYAVTEINVGVVAAYLIRPDDPDIHDPLGRVNIKPYDRRDAEGDAKDTVHFTFNPIGLHHPGFVDAVNRFVDKHFNGMKYGRFDLRRECESYMEMNTRSRLPEDGEAALKALGVKYKKKGDRLLVDGDLKMSGLGISRLPDLTKVEVSGGIDVSNNKLLSLEGLPQTAPKWLRASNNLLVCFAGAPADVGTLFDYQDNPYLLTGHGAPKADEYRFGNGKRDSSRYQSSKELVTPLEKPDLFPGFKRK